MKKAFLCILFASSIALTACQKNDPGNTPEQSPVPQETEEAAEETKNIATVVYEGVFVDSEEIAGLFNEVRGEAPYEKVGADPHVTTAFMPEKDARELYGKEITVRITGYKAGDVTSDEGDTVQAEGFKAEISSEDPDVQAYIEANPMNFHITGSYSYQAKYTGYLDFSDAQPLDYTLKGKLGAYLTSGIITFTADDVDKEY